MADPRRFLLCLETEGGDDAEQLAHLVQAAVEHSTAREALETAITAVMPDVDRVSLSMLALRVEPVPPEYDLRPLRTRPAIARLRPPEERAPLECAPLPHTRDEDCAVVDGSCIACHVEHGEPCPACGKRAFHVDGCRGGAPPEEPKHRCSGCASLLADDDLDPLQEEGIFDVLPRAGDQVPTGACPKCHSLAYALDPGDDTTEGQRRRLIHALRLVLPYAETRVEDVNDTGDVSDTSPRWQLVAEAGKRYDLALETLRDIAPELFDAEGHLITVQLPEQEA